MAAQRRLLMGPSEKLLKMQGNTKSQPTLVYFLLTCEKKL